MVMSASSPRPRTISGLESLNILPMDLPLITRRQATPWRLPALTLGATSVTVSSGCLVPFGACSGLARADLIEDAAGAVGIAAGSEHAAEQQSGLRSRRLAEASLVDLHRSASVLGGLLEVVKPSQVQAQVVVDLLL